MFGRKTEGNPPSHKPLELTSFDELLGLKIQIEALIGDRGREELESLRDKIVSLTKTYGVSIPEFFGIKETEAPPVRKRRGPKSGAPVKRYVNPDKPEEHYRGRGKRPWWLEGKLAAGHDIEEFRIQANGSSE